MIDNQEIPKCKKIKLFNFKEEPLRNLEQINKYAKNFKQKYI